MEQRTSTEGQAANRWGRWLEFLAAAVMSFAVLLSAYCAYESTRWSGVQAIRFAEASASRIEAGEHAQLGAQQLAYDAATFQRIAIEHFDGDDEAFEFLREHVLRDEFVPFFEQWIASRPLENPDAPRNPFELEEFTNAELEKAEELHARAARRTEQAKQANQNGDDYVLATVFFASVLFFAGISSRFDDWRVQATLVALALVGLAAGVIRLATLPFY